ncbi:uncharacterized protein N7503_004291 [Penicillium pulvis]|uniref:uncharacterized protein n=1 Tax=Penicillium pulvis TaxID=1562058 RepID=UPI002546BCB8|nr:uncharacterized protein N7503_004291 [Penicillium pulvis]KAJ5801841.1 hypothetical protein N7503_004291 [Penicillium pulvis]
MNRQKRHDGHGSHRPSHPRVPPSRSINPGTPVKIVLKSDQPTGRTVSGIVNEVLTRGDHPRGVKVRLTDGRVGRVQSLWIGNEPSDSTQEEANPGEGLQLSIDGDDISGRRNRFAARDMHLKGPYEPPPEALGLDMYIRPAKGKKRAGKIQERHTLDEGDFEAATAPQITTASVSCPVCGAFEGDAAAVAHHVTGHFE